MINSKYYCLGCDLKWCKNGTKKRPAVTVWALFRANGCRNGLVHGELRGGAVEGLGHPAQGVHLVGRRLLDLRVRALGDAHPLRHLLLGEAAVDPPGLRRLL